MNCVENLPIFAAVVLAGRLLELPDEPFGLVALAVLGARVLQTSAHLLSGSTLAVNVRFCFYAVQVVAMGWMAFEVVQALAL